MRKNQGVVIIGAVLILFLLCSLKVGQPDPEQRQEAGPSEGTEAEGEPRGTIAELSEAGLTDRVKSVPGYIKGLEYDDGMTMQGSGSYAGWKDVLIIGDSVYKLEDDVYRKTEQTAYDLFGLFPLEKKEGYGKIRQYESLIVTKKADTFLICDLDTQPYSVQEYDPLAEGEGEGIDPFWYIYEGELIYQSRGEDGRSTLWAYDLESREAERIDTWTEPEASAETAGYEETRWQAICGDGLFFYDNSRKIYGNGGVFLQGVLGEPEETGIGSVDGTILTEKGYFRYDGKKDLIFYDLDGNERASWRIREEGLGEAYSLKYLIYNVYDRGRLLCFYENPETGQLHLNQISVELPELSEEERGLSYWLEEGADHIFVTPGQERGNILGYTFRRDRDQMQYVREPDWLVKNAFVGKGIFRSEHMSENSVFLGEILRDILNRQKISEGNRQYFSKWAQESLEITEEEKELLCQGKAADRVRYDCSYRVNRVFGLTGYDFCYRFYGESAGDEAKQGPAAEKDASEEAGNWEALVQVTVDWQGIIRDMQIRADVLADGRNTYYGRQQEDFFREDHEESIIQNGEPETGKIVIDFGKYWQQYMEYDKLLKKIAAGPGGLLTKDAAESGEAIERILRDVLESRGKNAVLYGEVFQSDYDFYRFQNLPWENLSKGWKSDGEYDCYFSDMTEEEGCIKLRYYMYPAFAGGEETEEAAAQAVIFEVKITDEGKLADTALQAVFLTQEERMTARKKDGNGLMLIRDGEDTGSGAGVRITDSLTEEAAVFLDAYRFDEDAAHGNRQRNQLLLWECEGATELASYVGDAILEDLNEKKVESGMIRELLAKGAAEEGKGEQEAMLAAIEAARKYAGNKWRGDGKYDCRYVGENERNGCLHFRYTFYRDKPFEGKLRNIVADVYLSERGIEKIEARVVICREEWLEKR